MAAKLKLFGLLIIVMFFVSSLGARYLWVHEDDNTKFSPLTECIQSRYYYIERLSKTVEVLSVLYKKNPLLLKKAPLVLDDMSFISQKPIVLCIDKMNQEQNLQPLFFCWQQMIMYKFVMSDKVMDEFVKLLFVVMRHIAINVLSRSIVSEGCNSLDISTFSTQRLVDYIDVLTDRVTEDKKTIRLSVRDLDTDSVNAIGSGCVVFRFYLLQRLRKSLFVLKRLREQNVFIKSEKIKWDNFSHQSVIECFEEIISSKRIDSLIKLYDGFSRFQFIDDVRFLKELLILLLITHKNILSHKDDNSQLKDLSVCELLDTLDIVVEKVDHHKKDQAQNSILSKKVLLGVMPLCAVLGYFGWSYIVS